MRPDRPTFDVWRQQVAARQGQDLRRFDEILPYKPLAALKKALPDSFEPAPIGEAVSVWQRVMRYTPPQGLRIVPNQGVRDALNGLFRILADRKSEIYLPEDTYPAYWQLAGQQGIQGRSFVSFPKADWSFLDTTGPKAAVVMASPAVLTGKSLTKAELRQLKQWLKGSPERLLIIDGVYNLRNRLSPELKSLLASGQCVYLHSLTKGWLVPRLMGFAVVPDRLAGPLEATVTTPSAQAVAEAFHYLKDQPRVPLRIQKTLTHAWKSLQETLQKLSPGWQPPPAGYFSWLPLHSRKLLEDHQLLAIPASVFGAQKDVTIISNLTAAEQMLHKRKKPSFED